VGSIPITRFTKPYIQLGFPVVIRLFVSLEIISYQIKTLRGIALHVEENVACLQHAAGVESRWRDSFLFNFKK
jgi:hypothetical protein